MIAAGRMLTAAALTAGGLAAPGAARDQGPAIRASDDAPVEELMLGESAWLQEASVLQLAMWPRWRVGAAVATPGVDVEYGITDGWQVELALESPDDDGSASRALGAQTAVQLDHGAGWRAAAGLEITDEDALTARPFVAATAARGALHGNATVAVELGAEATVTEALAAYWTAGAVTPIAELALVQPNAAMAPARTYWSVGATTALGGLELTAAMGGDGGDRGGVTISAVVSWEYALRGAPLRREGGAP